MAAVTLVGAGRIGLPVVGNLVTSGHEVDVVDIDKRRRADVRAAGASWAGHELAPLPTERILITVLPGNDELRAVTLDSGSGSDDARLRHLRPGGTWIDMTSAAPDLSARMMTAGASRGVQYLDAAIGGGPVDAQQGRLTLYVAERARISTSCCPCSPPSPITSDTSAITEPAT
jgi:3-hydroxyisobutyrate dehydrogenase-like beta-hydroxyacid dehydrogenase